MALTTCSVHEKAGHHVDEGRPEKVHKVRSQEEPGNQAGELVEQLVLWSSKYYGDKADDDADCHVMKGHSVEKERQVLDTIIIHLDSIVTALMILSMVLGVTMATIFITFQVYTESLYVVQSAGKVASTLNMNDSYILTKLNHSLADQGFSSMENVVDGAYNLGRDWISSTLQRSLSEADADVRADLETKVLELWDRSYQYWVLTSVTTDQRPGPTVSKEAITNSVGEVLDKLLTSRIHANIFNYTAMQTFVKENMGTLTSIMETSWTLFKGNIGFLFDTILGVIKIFFYGGTGFVNLVFGIVIYLTALFYLLSNSANTYIPMDLATQYSLFQVSGVGSSIQKAVNSVFLITVKMSSFYLLWTYVTHVVFQASIVVLPLLFSSFIAACPFTGQHIVALPAALELWLLQQRPLAATLLVLMQVAPSWLVDGAIYSEIRGGLHPWFTGLAVVGGVYVFGVLGAIYGPLALCSHINFFSLSIQFPRLSPTAKMLKARTLPPQGPAKVIIARMYLSFQALLWCRRK